MLNVYSAGIGAALAVEYAAPGVTLGLLGRNEGTLINFLKMNF